MSNRETYKQYLLSKGLSPLQVQGILPNVGDESGFSPNPSGPNDGGMSYGLFQHYGPRRDALFRYAGTSSPSWQQQLDYALTEPEMQAYLQNDYSNVGDAAVGFLDNFEKPAKQHRDARAAKYRREYGHWQPDGQTVPASAIAGDPSVYSGSIAPVSAVPPGGSSMYPQLTPPPAPPPMAQMPQLSSFQQAMSDPMLMTGLSLLTGAVSGQPFGAALQGGMMGGYGNALAMQQLQQKQLDRDYSHKQALWEFQNQQAQQAQEQAQLAQNLDATGWSDTERAIFSVTGKAPQTAEKDIRVVDGKLISVGPDGASVVPVAGMPEDQGRYEPDKQIDLEAKSEKAFRDQIASQRDILSQWESVADYDPQALDGVQNRALVVAFAKSILPSESVMADDGETIKNAGRVFPQFQNLWDSAVRGETLPPKQAARIQEEIRARAARASDDVMQAWTQHHGRAEQRALNPEFIVGPTPGVPLVPPDDLTAPVPLMTESTRKSRRDNDVTLPPGWTYEEG